MSQFMRERGRGIQVVFKVEQHIRVDPVHAVAVCAGALGVQLAGPAWYFGEYYDKPAIGDALRAVESEDILRANRMLYAGSLLLFAVCAAVRWTVCAGR